MSRIIEECLKPKYGLLVFNNYIELTNWVREHLQEIVQAGAIYNKMKKEINFSNGATLVLAHIETEYDEDKYMGSEFSFMFGGSPKLRSRIRN